MSPVLKKEISQRVKYTRDRFSDCENRAKASVKIICISRPQTYTCGQRDEPENLMCSSLKPKAFKYEQD